MGCAAHEKTRATKGAQKTRATKAWSRGAGTAFERDRDYFGCSFNAAELMQ
jgi:hypothetical protein